MSAPMVTGAVALILQADPTNFPRPLLKSAAALLDNTWGGGKVNVIQAFTALVANTSPTVSLSTSPANGHVPLTVTLTATASDRDTGDSIAEYLWYFENDGFTDAITTTNRANKRYLTVGAYTAKVIAVDRRGRAVSATAAVIVSPPTTTITTTTTTTTTETTIPTSTTTTTATTITLTITTTTEITATTTSSETTPTTSMPVATTTSLISTIPPTLPIAGGGGCFIATAAYGSYLDPHVQTLRIFRDNVLQQSSWGRVFIHLYYRWSPPIAQFIAERPIMRGATRLVLTPVVLAVEQPRLSGGIFILGWAIAGTALFRLRRKDRQRALKKTAGAASRP